MSGTDATGGSTAYSTGQDTALLSVLAAPTVSVALAGGQANSTNQSTINFTVAFSEDVTGFATGDVTFTGSTATGTLVGTVTGSGTTYNVAVTGMTGSGTVVISIADGVAHDEAGNVNTASTGIDSTVTYDVTPPTVTINQAAAQYDPTSSATVLFSVIFSEAVTETIAIGPDFVLPDPCSEAVGEDLLLLSGQERRLRVEHPSAVSVGVVDNGRGLIERFGEQVHRIEPVGTPGGRHGHALLLPGRHGDGPGGGDLDCRSLLHRRFQGGITGSGDRPS